MSNSLAIEAVTRTLTRLLTDQISLLDDSENPDPDLATPGVDVTSRSPDKARDGIGKDQVNLFLYQTLPNTAWRNQDIPPQIKLGESGSPPLALTLYYLVTAYSHNDKEELSHRLLGRAMRIFHDHPVLSRQRIQDALGSSQLHEQVERVRVTPVPLSLEELSKLWMIFQTNYRISAAYEVSVVLIESTRPKRTPLPVLQIGLDASGAAVKPDLVSPYPRLARLGFPNPELNLHLNEILTIQGERLTGTTHLAFSHPRLQASITVTQFDQTETGLQVTIPSDPDNWPAGFYTVSAVVAFDGTELETNALAFAIAPIIGSISPPGTIPPGDISLTLTVTPKIHPGQKVSLLLGDREIAAPPITALTDQLSFSIKAVEPGDYLLRLRVDGVDSSLLSPGAEPSSTLGFNQAVSIQVAQGT